MSEQKKKILLLEGDSSLLSSMTSVLETEGMSVVAVSDTAHGKERATQAGQEKFDLIISDVSFRVLEAAQGKPPAPIILTATNASVEETREAHELGASAFLKKPFRKEDLLATLRMALGSPSPEYARIAIDDFVSGKEIRFSIFVQLADQKFVRVAHQGEDLDLERVRLFKAKGIKYLYLLKDDFRQYMNFNLGLSRLAVTSNAISSEKKANLLKTTQELVVGRLFLEEIDDDAVKDATSIVETTVQFLLAEDEHFNILDALNSHSDALYAHSVAVSMYSTLIARQLNWFTPNYLYKLSFAALMHDIGYKQIDRSLINKPQAKLDHSEIDTLQSHVQKGVEILSELSRMPTEVIQIVAQHHERDIGTGFPASLRKNRIAPLARVVAVADEFCYLVMKTDGSPAIGPREALNRLVAGHGSELDADSLDALSKVLRVSG